MPSERGELLALVGPADLQVAGLQGQVGHILLAPVDRLCELRVAGQLELGLRRHRAPGLDLGPQLLRRIVQQLGQLRAGLRAALVRARDTEPDRPGTVRGQLHVVREPAAGAVAERAVVTRRRLRIARRARFLPGAAGVPAWPVVGVADRPGRRPEGGSDHGRVVVGRCAGQRTVVGEDQPLAVVAALVRQVVAGVRGDPVEAPGILPHQLGVGVDRELGGARRAGVADRQSEQHAASAVGHDVGPGHPETRGGRQVVAGVAPAAGELRRRADPRPVQPEPDPVEQFHRRRPDPAHLAGDVPAVGVEAAVLEAQRVRPRAGRDLPAVGQPGAHRQLAALRRLRRHALSLSHCARALSLSKGTRRSSRRRGEGRTDHQGQSNGESSCGYPMGSRAAWLHDGPFRFDGEHDHAASSRVMVPPPRTISRWRAYPLPSEPNTARRPDHSRASIA